MCAPSAAHVNAMMSATTNVTSTRSGSHDYDNCTATRSPSPRRAKCIRRNAAAHARSADMPPLFRYAMSRERSTMILAIFFRAGTERCCQLLLVFSASAIAPRRHTLPANRTAIYARYYFRPSGAMLAALR